MLGFLYSKLRRITTNQLYFPEIDGIRFLAIVMVILFHIHGFFINKSGNNFTDSSQYGVLDMILSGGHYGVQLFFVLSGFILCLPFAQQYINNGKKVSLKKYYLRRLTRLEPPYFIAMIGLFLATLAMGLYDLPFLLKSLGASLVYLHEIIFRHSPYLTVVAWSLEIEIQFYILAPLLFKVLKLKPVLRRSILLLAIIIIIQLQQTYRLPFTSLYNYAQYFMAGILLSDLYVSGFGSQTLNKGVTTFIGILLLAGILCMSFMDWELEKFLFPFLIIAFYLIVLKNDAIKKVFSYKFIPVIGGMCYSIYLLHYPIVSMFGRFTIGLRITNYYLPNLILQIILLMIPVLVISSVYYYFIERPFMSSKWMDKLVKKNKKDETINPVSVPGAE
jgi:peptidoglycan/LPS O-acetylase OafA/YrhL